MSPRRNKSPVELKLHRLAGYSPLFSLLKVNNSLSKALSSHLSTRRSKSVNSDIENGKRSHRIGKFNILSVNVILFQGNQKGSAFRVGTMPILVCLQKNSSDFRTIREISRHARMFS